MISSSIISFRDSVGGASISAFRLHRGLRALGVHSQMLVASKLTSDPDVLALSPPTTFCYRLARRLRQQMRAADSRKLQEGTIASGLFTDDRTIDAFPILEAAISSDVLNIHWASNFVDYGRFLKRVPENKPVVWTLQDMNPFTGGCHYSFECQRFRAACGACPFLKSDDARDVTSQIHARKLSATMRRDPRVTRVVALSEWLAKEARASSIFRRFDVEVIHHGIDLDLFQPRDRLAAREVFGIPQDHGVVMFAAAAIDDQRKGLRYLRDAMKGLKSDIPVTLVSVGAQTNSILIEGNHISLGPIESERLLSFAYSAADMFVMPTLAEAQGLVVIEAMACGVPVIGFNVGGIPDMVVHEETGLLVEARDVIGLRRAIELLLHRPDLREKFSTAGRAVVSRLFSLQRQAQSYKELFLELVDSSRTM
jgi:glycosyltransferase involved in cell wall biosynthesis